MQLLETLSFGKVVRKLESWKVGKLESWKVVDSGTQVATKQCGHGPMAHERGVALRNVHYF